VFKRDPVPFESPKGVKLRTKNMTFTFKGHETITNFTLIPQKIKNFHPLDQHRRKQTTIKF